MKLKYLPLILLLFIASTISITSQASCVDNVVLVHGNTGSPDDWVNTYELLINNGYQNGQIYRPSWGGSSASYNDHNGSEEVPVHNAISSAIANSCTGKIDVIAHSMGVTLAAQQIIKLNQASNIDSFVGIAGAYRGLWTCGTYPFNIWTPTCGTYGLSVSSPFLDWLYAKPIANRVYSIKSWIDEIVCGSGICTVGGVHSSHIYGENASYTYNYGHFGLQTYTANKQFDLIK